MFYGSRGRIAKIYKRLHSRLVHCESIGFLTIPEMGRFYGHVLIEKNFPHHGGHKVAHKSSKIHQYVIIS